MHFGRFFNPIFDRMYAQITDGDFVPCFHRHKQPSSRFMKHVKSVAVRYGRSLVSLVTEQADAAAVPREARFFHPEHHWWSKALNTCNSIALDTHCVCPVCVCVCVCVCA